MKNNCDNINELSSKRVKASDNAHMRVTERKQTNKRVNLIIMKCENVLESN